MMNALIRCASLLTGTVLVTAPAWGFPAPDLATDAPWAIHQTASANFPLALMRVGVTHGEARVRVSIAANGELLDALLVASSRRDFGDEALRTVKKWRFDAEREKGVAIGIVADIEFVFDVSGPVAIEKRSLAPKEETEGPFDPEAYGAQGLKRLDRIPTPTHIVSPVYPKEWSDRGIHGSATVEFYIDETGRVRIPVVTASDHRLLGASAVAAVAQWHFEPPTYRGKPVLTRVEQVLLFEPEKK